jgi:hypothetical protein
VDREIMVVWEEVEPVMVVATLVEVVEGLGVSGAMYQDPKEVETVGLV